MICIHQWYRYFYMTFHTAPLANKKIYQPISLLSPKAKTQDLNPTTHQHGFQKVQSTTSAFNVINNQMIHGFNPNLALHANCPSSIASSNIFNTAKDSVLLSDIEDSCCCCNRKIFHYFVFGEYYRSDSPRPNKNPGPSGKKNPTVERNIGF